MGGRHCEGSTVNLASTETPLAFTDTSRTAGYRAAMMLNYCRFLSSLALLLAGSMTVTGCSNAPAEPYAVAYRDALQRIQGTTTIGPEMTERFVTFFSHAASPEHCPSANADAADCVIDPGDLYGDPLYFSDTLLTTGNRDVALDHLRRMRDATGSLEIRVIDTHVNGQDAYVVWQMEAQFAPVRRTVISNTVGVTHLRFDDGGRIVLQQDFWDSAEGFYRHLPIVGGIINSIRGTFDAD
jgi:hypothetical protein